MEHNGSTNSHSPQHEDKDRTPTSRTELMGWYAYAVGAEAFAVCGVGSFLPITLEQLARERGVLWTDKASPCVQTAPSSGAGSSALVLASTLLVRSADKADNNQCVVRLLGRDVNTASFAMYTFSLAVLVQAITLVSFSSFADYGNNRKTLLLALGFSGAFATMLFMLVFPKIYLLGSVLVVVSITCMGCSWVILNSFLPLLVVNHASTRVTNNKPSRRPTDIALDSFRPNALDPNPPDLDDPLMERFLDRSTSHFQDLHFEPISPELQLSNKISSMGVGIGYGAAVLVQCLSILLIFSLSKTSMSSKSASLPLHLVLLLIGLWWFGFTLVSRALIRNRPGPPLISFNAKRKSRLRLWLALVSFAWTSLWKTVKVAARLRQVIIFLLAWFLLSDAVATVSATAILFAKTELNMATTSVALLSIVSTASGIVGAFAWPIISKRLQMNSNHTIIACIALFELIPLYGLLAFIPLVKTWGVLGLQQPWEIFPLACIHGFVAGGLGSYCRSLFGRLIPPGSEAAFYALYAITDKGSSFFGPVLVGVLVDNTGEIRSGFIFLAILIVLPIPLIWAVDIDRGRRDGLEMAQVLKSSGMSHTGIQAAPSSEPEGFEEREGLLGDEV